MTWKVTLLMFHGPLQNPPQRLLNLPRALTLIVNGNFDQSFSSDDTRGTGRLRNLGQWHRKNSFGIVANVNGQTVFTSSSSAQARIIQAITVDPQYLYTVNFDFGGNASLLIYMFNKNQKLLGYTLPTKNSSSGTATIEVPANVEYLQVLAYTSNKGWIDNMTLAQVDEPDTDNDGIVDRLDDYPQNATKSFASFYPLIGRQTLAFEDLWPHTGDFDFNDLVLSNLMEYAADTSGQLVDANYKVMVNANGAGIASGVAMVLLQPNGQPFNSNIISSVSGDATLDPDVTNGIIVFDHISQALAKPYANNGQGHDGTPEEFEFQIGFNQNIGSSRVLADIYMFRAGERGREIHLDGFGPTAAADPSLFNTGQDINGTYSTKTGLPWAIEIVYPGTTFFRHPLEKVDILKAYPNFQTWAESNGSKQVGWMIHPDNDKVYKF
ncbi:MAG: LruC domain-containing protein [Owenweeksia sp.]|nr:LruC domain-containing protein [Owenweeksia sp.]